MTDEELSISDATLIARLRAWDGSPFDDDAHDADDRIEELEAKALANRVAVMRLEAKLAKAVEALENLADCVDLGCFCSEMQMATAMDIARTTLAEIKGESQDGMV